MEIKHKLNNLTLQITMVGELDEASATKARFDIDSLIENNRIAEVIFDFSEVEFMDSTGIGILLGRYKKLLRKNVEMFIVNTRPQVDKVFKMSGIYEIIKKLA
ncbi:MAG: anti-sigma factor antagonist [Clostridia bacterium]